MTDSKPTRKGHPDTTNEDEDWENEGGATEEGPQEGGYFQIVNAAGCPHWSPWAEAPGGTPVKGDRAICGACLRMGRSEAEATGIIDSIRI